jgi:hypothetical protein
MNNYISAIRLPNYEDNDQYGQTSCTLKHWPDLWPEEMAADGALYRERMRQKQQTFFMARDDVHRTIQYFRTKGAPRHTMNALARQALLSLAEWNDWQVKNGDCVRVFGVTPIIATRHCDDEVLENIENFMEHERKLKRKLQALKAKKVKPNHKRAVELALLSLIDEQGWQRVEQHPRRNITIYHYKV